MDLIVLLNKPKAIFLLITISLFLPVLFKFHGFARGRIRLEEFFNNNFEIISCLLGVIMSIIFFLIF